MGLCCRKPGSPATAYPGRGGHPSCAGHGSSPQFLEQGVWFCLPWWGYSSISTGIGVAAWHVFKTAPGLRAQLWVWRSSPHDLAFPSHHEGIRVLGALLGLPGPAWPPLPAHGTGPCSSPAWGPLSLPQQRWRDPASVILTPASSYFVLLKYCLKVFSKLKAEGKLLKRNKNYYYFLCFLCRKILYSSD